MAANTTAAPATGTHYMQGIAVPASSVRPEEFFARTRRHTSLESTKTFDGQQHVFELRKSDILSSVQVRFSGQVVVTPGTGTVATTARWPYDMATFRFTANGASNIINCSGLKLKARELMKKRNNDDRGVQASIGGQTLNQGTLSTAGETWGVGSRQGNIPAGTYPIELTWTVPVSEDEIDLAGAVFLATSTADLTLTLDYLPIAQMFNLTGNAAVSLTGNVSAISTKFSIPIGADGQIVVPDLSMFHSLIQSRSTNVQNGENEVRLVGQGGGKSLLRSFYQVWSGAGSSSAPLPQNAATFGPQSWRYGNNETPDQFMDGVHMRQAIERKFNSDLGGAWAFGVHDFASDLEFRDVVDMGTTSDLRLVMSIGSGVALSSPVLEYVNETVFRAGQGA